MDSTLLALIAQETKLKKIPLVHYCSDSPLENELYEAKRVAKYLGKELIIATRKTSIINEDKFMHTSNQYPQLDKSLTYGKIITECGINESTLFINGIGGDSLFKDNLPNPINYFQNIDKFMAECVSIDENLVKFFRQNITGGLAGSFFEHVMDAKKKCYLFNSNKHSINLINNINMLEKYTKRYSKPTSYWLPLLSEMGNAFSIKVNEEVSRQAFPLLSAGVIEAVLNWQPKRTNRAGHRIHQRQLIRDLGGSKFVDGYHKTAYEHTTEVSSRPIVEFMYRTIDLDKFFKRFSYVDRDRFIHGMNSIEVESIVAVEKLLNILTIIDLKEEFNAI